MKAPSLVSSLRCALLGVSLVLAPRAELFACAVCFGGADSDMVKGFTWGIWILLVLPYALAAGLIAMIVRHVRKQKEPVAG